VIGLVLSDPGNPFFTEFAAAIGTEAARYDRALMMATSRASEDAEARLIDDLVRRQVDGLIVASVFGRPDLTVGRANRNTPTVWIDAAPAVAEAAREYLRPGDAVLVKASRAVGLEGIADEIANFARAWSPY